METPLSGRSKGRTYFKRHSRPAAKHPTLCSHVDMGSTLATIKVIHFQSPACGLIPSLSKHGQTISLNKCTLNRERSSHRAGHVCIGHLRLKSPSEVNIL